jgi:hydrogenase maturation protease
LIGDDGFGSRFAQNYKDEIESLKPGSIEVIDMGAHTIEAIDYLKDHLECQYLYIIDIINTQKSNEDIIVLEKEDLTNQPKSRIVMSNHSGGVSEILETSEFMGCLPQHIQLIGAKPFNMETGMSLSHEVERHMEKIRDFLVTEIKKNLNLA